MATMTFFLLLLLITTHILCIAFAFDPMPMHDFCVADKSTGLRLNGPYPCKDPKSVTASDFYYTGLDVPTNTTNTFHAGYKLATVEEVPGLNTLGLSMARLDLGPGGLFSLHRHGGASELHIVIQGQLEVGFISPEQGYKYYNKTLSAGDMFVIPPGLIHLERNPGNEHVSSYAILNSQNIVLDFIAQAVFGANPAIDANYLAAGYQLDVNTIKMLQGKSWS